MVVPMHLLEHGWICLLKSLHEICLHLFFVLLGHLGHCLQIGENLALLVDLFDIALTFGFDLIYAPIELINQRSDLLLVSLFFCQFPLNYTLALSQLIDISLHFIDFFAHFRIGFREFDGFFRPYLSSPIQLICFLFCFFVSIGDLTGLFLDHVSLTPKPLHQSLDIFLFADFFIDKILLCMRDAFLALYDILSRNCATFRPPAGVHQSLKIAGESRGPTRDRKRRFLVRNHIWVILIVETCIAVTADTPMAGVLLMLGLLGVDWEHRQVDNCLAVATFADLVVLVLVAMGL